MSLASMLWIPGYAIYYIATQRGSLRDVSKDSKKSVIRNIDDLTMNEDNGNLQTYFLFSESD